jgi:hypothetical protein
MKRCFARSMGAGLLWAVIATSQVFAAGYKRYYEGNSLTGGVAKLFSDMAKDAGYADDAWNAYNRAGQPLDFGWHGGRETIEQDLQAGAPWDFVQVQPFSRRYPVDEGDPARRIFQTALKYSPNCTLMVYLTWVGNPSTFDSHADWEADMQTYINDQCVRIADYCESWYPDKPIFVVPSSPAMMALNDSIKAGNVPGFSSIAEIYNDGIHMNANGNYLNACVHYAAYYQQSPIGLSHDYTVSPAIYTQDVTLTDEQALIFQRTAWDVVRNYPRTLVSRQPKVRPDTERPSQVTGLSINPLKNALEVSYASASDNIDVAEYLVYVDDDWYGSSATTDATIHNGAAPAPAIQPGNTYDVYVRARDAEYNLGAPSETLTVSTPETIKGDDGKFDFGTGQSPVADGYNEVLVTEGYDATNGYGYDPVTTTKRSRDDADETDAFLRDKHSYYGGMNFRYDAPDGDYRMVFWLRGDSIEVYAGDDLQVAGLASPAGAYLVDSIDMSAVDGHIDVSFKDLRGSSGRKWFSLAGLVFKPLSTSAGSRIATRESTGQQLTWNPAARTLMVNVPGHAVLSRKVLDLQGRTLLSARTSDAVELHLPHNVPAGMYVFRVRHTGGIVERRFVLP